MCFVLQALGLDRTALFRATGKPSYTPRQVKQDVRSLQQCGQLYHRLIPVLAQVRVDELRHLHQQLSQHPHHDSTRHQAELEVVEQELRDIEFAQKDGGDLVLHVMEAVDVAFVSPNASDRCHLIPSLLPSSPNPDTAHQWTTQAHSEGSVVMGACVEMDHIPTSFVGRLLVHCSKVDGRGIQAWQHGAVFRVKSSSGVVCRVLVTTTQPSSSSSSSSGGDSPMLVVLAQCQCGDATQGIVYVFLSFDVDVV